MTSGRPAPALSAMLAGAGAGELAEGFGEADVDGDGGLAADECLAAVVTALAARAGDRDGVLATEDLPGASPEAPAAGDRIVRVVDADADRHGVSTLPEPRACVEALAEGAPR